MAANELTERSNVAQQAESQKNNDFTDIAYQTQDILIRADSVFPFVLFPDTISVSRMKVAITKRSFFNVAEVISLQISDILNIEVDTGPFFGSIKIYTRIYGTDPLKITFLSRSDAINVKQIIEGHIIAHKQNLNIDSLSKDELIKLLKHLGNDGPLT